jgi:hypothetical protein
MRSHLATSLNQNQKNMRNSVNLKSHLVISFNQSYMTSHLATLLNQNQKMCKKWYIVMGDLPRWKEYEKRSRCDGWSTQMEDGKNMKCGLVVMGDLPRWKMEKMWSAVSL